MSLSSPGWHQTPYPPASGSEVLELEAMPLTWIISFLFRERAFSWKVCCSFTYISKTHKEAPRLCPNSLLLPSPSLSALLESFDILNRPKDPKMILKLEAPWQRKKMHPWPSLKSHPRLSMMLLVPGLQRSSVSSRSA